MPAGGLPQELQLLARYPLGAQAGEVIAERHVLGDNASPPGDQACKGWDCLAGAMKSVDGRVMYVLLTRQYQNKIEATLVYW
ncbi:hypothetical protein ACIHFD_26045 [Nonomuraea sp. NPDC051941]|uniref:hypothetical protein n=1 Tax=Nonomuraea sp. NPDC051941 TaxID=3364373 RepID=UPI0037C5C1E4